MSLWVLDTDTLSLLFRGHAAVRERVVGTKPGELRITIVTVEEILSGWYAEIRRAKTDAHLLRAYRALHEAVEFTRQAQILAFDEQALALYRELRSTHRRLGSNDLKIAAITLQHKGALATCNLGDFTSIEGLVVEDWSRPLDRTRPPES